MVERPHEHLTTGGLPHAALDAIRQVLVAHSIEGALLFGSRALGRQRPNSDIDIALEGDIPFDRLAKLQTAIDDLEIPQKIDLVPLAHVDDEALLDHIRRVGQRLLPTRPT